MGLSQVEAAALMLCSEAQGPGLHSWEPRELRTEVQTVEGWVVNDGKLRSAVQLFEEDIEARSAAVGRSRNVGCLAHFGCIAGMGLLGQDRIGWRIGLRIAATGKAGVKGADHIAVLAVPAQDNGTGGLAHCSPRLAEVMCSVVSSDGLVHTAGHFHLANSPRPAGGVGHGSGSSHEDQPNVLRQ